MRAKTLYRLSLKRRLIMAALFWLTAMILAAGIIIPKLIHEYLADDMESRLALSMDEITAHLELTDTGQLVVTSSLSDPRFNQPYSGLYWRVQSGDEYIRSRSLWDRNIRFKEKEKKPVALGAKNEPLIYIERSVYLPNKKQAVEIFVGIDKAPLTKTLSDVVGQLWIILVMLFAGVLIFVELQIRWSLKPLNTMQKELNALRDGTQSRLDQHYPKEIAPVVRNLNALLFHYQELLSRARQHAGNLSHALKTPLSVLKNEAAMLDSDTQSKITPSLEQLQQHIDYHLGRARMAGAMNILSVKSTPALRVDAISQAFDKVYAHRNITLVNELDSDLEVAVESADLDEMLGNLLENAYKWGHSLIRVYAVITKDSVTLVIEDDGEGIPDSQLERVLERGIRLDETVSGTGLGLNIVSEMAHSYRGALTLETSASGGLKANLRLLAGQSN
ncbi:ATP-binding protein [Vibrio sonorensis]|uniref:ATP-binding protein n=1 Tax=Vibrio sonorensis TaxID=1004316 RepID=UPI0008DA7967|nr:ATP-binding protein [Vibrio sonorensis]